MALNPDKLNKNEFKGLMYSLDKPAGSDKGYRKIHPDLRQYDEFNFRITHTFPKEHLVTWDNLFSYVVLMYDQNSPFVRYLKGTQERKRYVLYYIKVIEELNAPLNDSWNQIIQNKYFFVSKMIIRYCMLQRSTEYTYYVMSSERLYKYLIEAMDDVQMSKECKSIRKELNEVKEDFFLGGEQSLDLALEQYIGELTYPISPEAIALAKSKGKNPYEGLELKFNQEIDNPLESK